MITVEEYNDIQVGDKIKIVDEWDNYTHESVYGNMDYLLGETFEVTHEATTTTVEKDNLMGGFVIRGIDEYSKAYWSLNLHCIAKVIKCTTKSIADDSLEKMLGVSV